MMERTRKCQSGSTAIGRRARELQHSLPARDRDLPAVELLQQVLLIGGDDVDDFLVLRFRRRQARRFGDRLFAPFGIAAAQLREAPDVSGGVLHGLALVRIRRRRLLVSVSVGAVEGVKPIDTGDAAPRFVPGAMAATWLAYRMNVPALAARAPDGATYATTGTGDARISCTIPRIDVSSPPGVSRVSTTSCALSFAARASPRCRYSPEAGPMTPVTCSATTGAGAAASAAGSAQISASADRNRRMRIAAVSRATPTGMESASRANGHYPLLALRGGNALRRSTGRAPNSGVDGVALSASSSAVASAASSCRSRCAIASCGALSTSISGSVP